MISTYIHRRFSSLTSMSISSDEARNARALHVYRVPAHARRSRAYHDRPPIPYVRSPSADSTVIVSRRRHSSPRSTVRIVELPSPEPPTYVKRYYPPARTRRVIRERSPLSTTPDSTFSIDYPPPLTLAQRRLPEQRVVRLATASTSAGSRTDLIVPVARRSRRAFVERPVAIVSETPLVNRGTSPRKQWKKRETTIPLDVHRDVYISDEDYYEEAFPDGVSNPMAITTSRSPVVCFRVTNRNPTNSARFATADALVVVHNVTSVSGTTAARAAAGSHVCCCLSACSSASSSCSAFYQVVDWLVLVVRAMTFVVFRDQSCATSREHAGGEHDHSRHSAESSLRSADDLQWIEHVGAMH